jgi:hypothetical protein
MPFKQEQENYIKRRFFQVEQIELNDENWNVFVTNLNEQIFAIENCINEEINFWINNNHTIRLIVLGEAPLSFNKFFYQTQGNFLTGLKKFYETTNPDLKNVLRQNGIFVLDAYRFPIKTGYYDGVAGAILFDEVYLNNKCQQLRNLGLINDDTKIVFRYQKLFERQHIINNENIINKYLTNVDRAPISLYANGEYGYVALSPEVIYFLQNN